MQQNSIQKIIQNSFCMVNSIQNLIQNFEISWIQFNKIFIQFEIVGVEHGYVSPSPRLLVIYNDQYYKTAKRATLGKVF